VLLKEIFVCFLFFHWTQRTGISPVCRETETAISENAAIPHFLRKKNLKTEVDGWLAVADSLNQLLSP